MVTIFFQGGHVTTCLPSMWSCPFHICFYSIIMFSSFNKRKEISKTVARSFNYSIIFYVFDCLFVKTHPFPNEALADWGVFILGENHFRKCFSGNGGVWLVRKIEFSGN